ncbi:hypothetical protein ACFLTX_00365 [Chloroflexota bacterium]
MHKSSIAGLLLVILCACSSTAVPTSTTLPGVMTPTRDKAREEELVYDALLKELFSSDLYVFMNMTQTDILGLADTETYLAVEKTLGDLTPGLMLDFKRRNESSHSLKTSMILEANYIVFSIEDMQEMFGENQNGWDIFYDRYPDAPGIISLSRVGFNQEMDQALVYLGIQSHWLAGSGTYYLMVSRNGSWIIQQSFMTWIS